jgi:ketosteroid isomerase-like protein
MKTTLILALLLLAPAPVLAANGTSDLAKISATWAEDWSAKKLDAVMAFYAPEPVFLPTVGPRWEGTDAIRKNFAGVLATYNPHIALHSLMSEASGALAYDSGTYEETITPVKGGAPIPAKGSYLFIFQRQKSGAWKILEQAWTELEPMKL